MERRNFIKNAGILAGAGLINKKGFGKKIDTRPNIVYILADDLGYGDLGVYGQKIIQTPNIDKLAKNGIIFSDHYSGSPVCAPSRCVLLTGLHSGHAYIRGNDEWGERGDVWNFKKASENENLEGQRPLHKNSVTIGKLLQKKGYKTACIGKWGLGPGYSEGSPNKQGFDLFFGYNCQRQAHTYYPKHLWKNRKKIKLNNKLVIPGTRLKKGSDPYDPDSYSDYTLNDYAPDLMGREALKFIEENKKNPFFLYYASPLPHLPLQAPKEYVDKYRKIIGEEEPYTKKSYFPCRYPRATYAAMINYLDDEVGKIVRKLKDTDQYDNTLIIFSSDNGPTYTGGADTEFFKSGGVFGESYGRGKGFTHEGGIRVPMIASWPGKIKPGTQTDHVSAFYDILPTLCELSAAKTPEKIDGISFLPALLEKGIQKKHKFLYWEFPSYNGQQAVRMGKWKGLRKNIFKGNLKIQLFDLSRDPSELNDVSKEYPEIVKEITDIMKKEHNPAILSKFKFRELGDK
ncbi:MAG: arylsulfatase [Acidobacteriota bacterium]